MNKSFYHSRLFLFFCIIGLCFDSGYALSTVYQWGYYIELILAYIFIFPIIKKYLKNKFNVLTTAFLLLIVMVGITFIATGMNSTSSYLSIIFKIVIALGIVTLYEFDKFIKIYLKLLTVISAIALVGYLMVNYSNLLNNLPIIENINSVPYSVGYLFFYYVGTPDRNFGIFWEPGLFATFLIIGLIFELIFKGGNISKFRILLFTITIVTTKSSAGYGLLLFIFCLIILKNASYVKEKYLRIVLQTGALFLAAAFLFNYTTIFKVLGLTENPVIAKMMGEQLSEQSRLLALNHNLSTFLESPLFGVGFKAAFEKIQYVADTSTSTYLISVFGILGLQYTIYWVVGIMKSNRTSFLVNLMIVIIFILIINKEPHYQILTSWCIMFYFLKSYVKNNDHTPVKGFLRD